MILEINLTWSRMVLILSRGFISLKHVSNGICDYNTCNFILFYRNCTVSVQPRIWLNACAIDIEVKWRQKRSKEVNQLKVEKGISVEKQMLQEIRENFDPYEKRLPGVKHLRKQKSKDESQRSNLLRRVYLSIISCQTVKTILFIDYTV